MTCPVCGSNAFEPAIAAHEIRDEIRLRGRFVLKQLGRRPSRAEAKDLTDFMHGFAAPLRICASCGLLGRAEGRVRDADSYSEDPNDPDIMRQLLPRYTRAFRNKAPGFRELLRDRADVLEIGSHLGAFLQVAEEWDWTAIGLDIGSDTSSFARANGFTVRREMVEDTRLRARSFDAVFVWNCFEQLPTPAPTLNAIYELLRPFGLAVIRVPNARFYLKMRGRNQAPLAWNNLLGFPYLYGYSEGHVHRIANDHGFEFVRGFDSELITMPFPDLDEETRERQCAESRKTARSSIRSAWGGPWIEMAYRKLEGPGANLNWARPLLREGANDLSQLLTREPARRFLARAA